MIKIIQFDIAFLENSAFIDASDCIKDTSAGKPEIL